MYANQFYFDEMEQTGNQIRIRNKMKAKTLMSLSVNFLDKDVLSQIQQLFLTMTPAEMKQFKDYLNGRAYLSPANTKSKEALIINQITRIAIASRPKDEYLAKIYDQYNQNLNKIDELKIASTKTIDGEKVMKLINEIEALNDENVKLFERVNAYREKKAG